ncbi:MAG: hypothetical protein GC152_16375 [Alphaproteobacteria bacterium]|nr:hypothetical protein [Alphaproteobacteria bacterium]
MRCLPLAVMTASIVTACIGTQSEALNQDQNTPLQTERMGVYVTSNDLGQSLRFYESVLGVSPEIQTRSFLGFNIAGGLFAVVDKETFVPEAKFGNNAVPYIRVTNLREVHAHVQAIVTPPAFVSDIIEEDYLSLFKLTDPDGNIVEFYAFSQGE